MTHPNRTLEDDLKRDIIAELTNSYCESYKNDRPNDTHEQLHAFCRDLAENDVEELLAADRKAQAAALLKVLPEDKPPMKVEVTKDSDDLSKMIWAEKRGFNEALVEVRSIIKEYIEGLDSKARETRN